MDVLPNLGINLPGFLWHTANFIVLIFLLSRILYKPIVGMLDERQRRIRESIEEAQAERAQSMVELRREVANLAVLAAERVISRNLDEQAQRQLVDEFLAER